jgi:hypothetical protein
VDGRAVESTTLNSSLQADDHANPGILVRPSDSKIIAAYTAHNNGDVRYRISSNPEDITSFGSGQTLSAASGGNVSYAQLASIDGRVYLFYRDEGGSGRAAVFRYSDDGGSSWSSQIDLVRSRATVSISASEMARAASTSG